MTPGVHARGTQHRPCLFVSPDPSDPLVFTVTTSPGADDSIPVIPTTKARAYWTSAADSSTDEAELRMAARRHPSRNNARAPAGD